MQVLRLTRLVDYQTDDDREERRFSVEITMWRKEQRYEDYVVIGNIQ